MVINHATPQGMDRGWSIPLLDLCRLFTLATDNRCHTLHSVCMQSFFTVFIILLWENVSKQHSFQTQRFPFYTYNSRVI